MMQTPIPSISQKPPVVTFYGTKFALRKLSDREFNDFFDKFLDDSNDRQLRAENWTADEWEKNRASYENWKAQNGYSLELLEVEARRREQVTVQEAAA